MQLVDAILDGRAGEDKGVAAAEAFNGLGGLGAPVLDALGFVEHDNVWTEAGVHVERVREHLFIIDDGEEGWGGQSAASILLAERALPARRRQHVVERAAVSLEPLVSRAEKELIRQIGETLDLLLPLGFERGGRDDQRVPRFSQAMQ